MLCSIVRAAVVLAIGPVMSWTLVRAQSAVPTTGQIPTAADGRSLNLGFEDGTLRDWTASGEAFTDQPVRGDAVAKRRGDMRSEHQGEYWIGGFEKRGDASLGTLTSAPFKLAQPWVSFRLGGGHWPETRVEILDAESQKVLFKASGTDAETLRPVVADLTVQVGKSVFIRVVDEKVGPWGHINFDDFRTYAQRPALASELTLAERQKAAPPPADQVAHAGLSASEAVKAATMPSGFALHVFATEPEVRQPIAFCEDHRGRLWVAEGYTYPKRVGHPPTGVANAAGADGTPSEAQLKDIFGGKDRILVFEDTDGDHKADKRTVFAENLNLVSGLEYGHGGLWVGAAPYLMFIPIVDGDSPKPAGPPRIMLDGWNYSADTHETLNTFNWGPDGWLYGCHGVFCPSHVGKPGATESSRQWVDAATWRYHPTRHKFEIFTEGGSNPWGIDFDEYGQLWAEMCVIPHLFHEIQGARITRQGGEHYCYNPAETARNEKHRDTRSRKPIFPYVYEDITVHADHVHYAGAGGPHAGNGRSDSSGGGHAHAGVMCYLGTSWPAEYRGQLFLGNIHGQRVNMDKPVFSGSGFAAQHGADFLNFNDSWSQTLNQRYDADGSMYIIDWYDKNQCHHNNEAGHDRSNGRIYKMVYQNQAVTRPDFGRLSDEELVKLVPSKNEWQSRHARRVLAERVAVLAESETADDVPEEWRAIARRHRAARKVAALANLRDQVNDGKVTSERLRALWALHVTGGLRLEDAGRWAEDSDPWVRSWTIQLYFENSEVLFGSERTAEVADRSVESLTRLAKDASPVVRRFVASALQRVPADRRWDALTALLAHTEDARDHNLPKMYWYAAEGGVATDRTRALALLKSCQIPQVREFIARRVAQAALSTGQ